MSLQDIKKRNRKNLVILGILLVLVAAIALASLFIGSAKLSVEQCWNGLTGNGSAMIIKIMWSERMPRMLAAIVAGAGLAVAGLIMQTVLGNPMASPTTLGVSNAAVFGANLSIIAFAGGFLNVGNINNMAVWNTNPLGTSTVAFLFATLSVLLILGLCSLRSFSANVVVLAGMAVGAMWTAATTFLQYYATDVNLSAAVVWSFGDLSRASYETVLIMLGVVLAGAVYFMFMAWKYNALLSGEATAKTMGIHVESLRFFSLLLASLITAVCISFLGVIGFVGIICPHVVKKLLGQDHRVTVPATLLSGSLLLLIADTVARTAGNGSALPVGAVTSLLGAPFFIAIIFFRKGGRRC